MTFTFNNYATSELNKSPINDIIQNMFSGYEQAAKAKYLQPNLEEQLKKAQLVNQYYGPNMESQIGLRGAQAGQARAHTGLLGEQTRGAHLENQYLPEKMQAQIQKLNAQAQQAKIMQMIREQLLGGDNASMQSPQDMNSIEAQQRNRIPYDQNQINQIPQGQPSFQQPMGQPSGLNYAKAATAMQVLGLGKPHIVDANGKYMAITPFGNIDTGVSGLTARDTALAKEDAKKISTLENVVLSGAQKAETFNELNTDLGSPEFEELRRNPILGRHEIGWYEKFGTPEQQEMIGRVKTHMGNIIKDSAKDFAGQFRVGEQALLNDMKPNVGDSINVMKGKAEALTFLNTVMTRRAELESDYMRNYGMSALQAKIASDKKIDSKSIKKEVHTILHPASSRPSPEQARAELERRRAGG